MAVNPYEAKASGGAASTSGNGSDLETGPQSQGQGQREGKRSKVQMSRANFVLAGLFIAGAATVYGLSFRGGPEQASAEQQMVEAQVDAAIRRLSQEASKPGPSEPGGVTQGVLKRFYDQIVERQVPLEGLRKNPFQFVEPGDAVAITEEPKRPRPGTGKEPTASPEDRAQAILDALCLQSVMVKPDGEQVAIISNNMVTVGQRVECFTVKEIRRKSVVLVWRGKDYVLKIR
jgi:hypothetical protein